MGTFAMSPWKPFQRLSWNRFCPRHFDPLPPLSVAMHSSSSVLIHIISPDSSSFIPRIRVLLDSYIHESVHPVSSDSWVLPGINPLSIRTHDFCDYSSGHYSCVWSLFRIIKPLFGIHSLVLRYPLIPDRIHHQSMIPGFMFHKAAYYSRIP